MKMSVAVDIKTVKAIMQNHKIFDQNVTEMQLEKINKSELRENIPGGGNNVLAAGGVRVNSGGRNWI